jgi:hypothetical protein
MLVVMCCRSSSSSSRAPPNRSGEGKRKLRDDEARWFKKLDQVNSTIHSTPWMSTYIVLC